MAQSDAQQEKPTDKYETRYGERVINQNTDGEQDYHQRMEEEEDAQDSSVLRARLHQFAYRIPNVIVVRGNEATD